MILFSAVVAVLAIETTEPPLPACLPPNALVTLPQGIAPHTPKPVCLRHGTKVYRVPTVIVDDTVVDAKGNVHGRSTTVTGFTSMERRDERTIVARTVDGREFHFNRDATYRRVEKDEETVIFVAPGAPIPGVISGLNPIYVVP